MADGPLPPGESGADGSRLPLAGFDRRVSAHLIDLICFGVILVLVFFLGLTFWGMLEPVLNTDNSSTYALGALTVALPALSALAGLAWGGLLTGLLGQTPGKAFLKLKVVTAGDHSRTIGFWRGAAREARFFFYVLFLLFVFFALPLVLLWLVDHLRALWDDQNQTWHDKVVGSHVVLVSKG